MGKLATEFVGTFFLAKGRDDGDCGARFRSECCDL